MSAEFWCGRQCVVIGSYLFLPTIGIATCDILQDIPIDLILLWSGGKVFLRSVFDHSNYKEQGRCVCLCACVCVCECE